MPIKPFKPKEPEMRALAAAECLWAALQPMHQEVVDEYVNQSTLKLLNELRSSVGRTVKALQALRDADAPIGKADIEFRMSAALRPQKRPLLRPVDPQLHRKQQTRPEGGSHLDEELQRLTVLYEALDGLDRRHWVLERRTAQSFIYIAARVWAEDVGMPSANGRFFLAIVDAVKNEELRALTQDQVRAFLKDWKQLPSTSPYCFKGLNSDRV